MREALAFVFERSGYKKHARKDLVMTKRDKRRQTIIEHVPKCKKRCYKTINHFSHTLRDLTDGRLNEAFATGR